MKYNCKECDFKWEGTVDTFEKVHQHEKEHLEKNDLKNKGDQKRCQFVVKFVTHQRLQMIRENLVT